MRNVGMIADISKYQGTVDWAKAREELDFCILRASCGLNPDVKFALNAAGCTRYGIPFHAYHYIKALDSDQAAAEAQLFHDTVKDTKVLFLVLDCEYKEITALEARKNGTAAVIVDAFVEKLKTLGWPMNRIAIYIGHHLYMKWALDYADFAYVWIPRYGKNDGTLENSIKPSYSCDLWQYTSEGTLAGVTGDVDLNQLTGSKPLSFFTALPQPEAAPEETTEPNEGSVSPMLTNLMLVQYCLEVFYAEWVYWYGTCGYACSTSLYNRKKKQYASHYTDSREKGYKADIAAGKMCADCVGLIKSFFWKGGDINAPNKYESNNCPDRSANGLFSMCEITGPISTIPDVPGLVVHKKGHIAVYDGKGKVIELRGFVGDCKYEPLSAVEWEEWGYLPESMLNYVTNGEPLPEPVVYELGDRIPLKKGYEGNDVAELQAILKSKGYDLGTYGANKDGIDGDYGSKTVAAVKDIQSIFGFEATGVFDAATHKALLDALAPELPPDDDEDTPEDGSAPAYVLIVEGDEATLRKAQAEYGGTLAAVDSVTMKNG